MFCFLTVPAMCLRAGKLTVSACAAPLRMLSPFSRCASTTAAGGASGGSSKGRMSFGVDPQKLDLQLNLSRTDFSVVAAATSAAVAQERTKMRDTLNMREVIPPSAVTSALDRAKSEEAATAGGRTVRGVVHAGAVHDSRNPKVAYDQARAESNTRYTLLDSLRDCCMTNNWAKAFGLFESALQKSLDAVPSPPSTAHTPAHTGATAPVGGETAAKSDDSRFAVLHNITASTPPAGSQFVPKSHLVGIMRWKGFHFQVLIQLLVKCHRWKEMGRVWDVIKLLGVLEYQLDGKVANSIISAIRRSTSSERSDRGEGVAEEDVQPSFELEATAKATARRIILDIEEVVKKRGDIKLNRSNQASVQDARVAQAIRCAQERSYGVMGFEGPEDADERSDEAQTAVEAGDFHGLLRRATSHKATMQVLHVMETLKLHLDGRVYANIIASLQNPLYLVSGAAESELQSNTAISGAQKVSRPTAEEVSCAKERYERYRLKRVAAAREWLERCPQSEWVAMLFNEYLYLVRGKDQAEEYARVLTLFRGNAMFSSTPTLQSSVGDGDGPVLPPQWKIRPDSKTYEGLIFRARYFHQWGAMWELLDEMRGEDIKGTKRTYHMLIAEAKAHPPPALQGDNEGIARLTMALYAEMRSINGDVKSLDHHANIINAWSVTRQKNV